MKHNMKKIISLVLVLAMTLAISVPGFAAEKDNQNAKTTRIKEISTEVTDISREEFLKSFAEQKGISFAEADQIDKTQTKTSYQKELEMQRVSLKNSAVIMISPKKTLYKKIRKTFNTGSSGAFKSQVTTVINAKLEQYESSSFGTYQKFTEVIDLGSNASCSGSYTWNETAQSASIDYDTGYENKIVMMVAGVIETEISASLQAGAEKSGFTFGGSIGGSYIFRKDVDLDYTFSSNYN